MKNYKEFFCDKGILITGGLGFIGSNLAYRLAKLSPKKIMLADALVPGLGGNKYNLEGIEDNVELITGKDGDIRNNDTMKELVSQADYIFNLAGSVSHIGSKKNPLFDLELNLESHIHFLETCKNELKSRNKPLKVVYSGTRDQYGKISQSDIPVNENYLTRQAADPQGINKGAAEFYHFWYGNHYGIQSCSLRLTNTYGPRHIMTDSGQGALNWFIRKAIDREEIELWDGGEAIRDFNHVDDVVEALLMSMGSEKSNGQAYNLGSFRKKNGLFEYLGGNITSIKNAAEEVIRIAGSGSCKTILYPADRKDIEPGHFYGDTTKIYEELGWEPKISLQEGLKRTIEFYRQNKEKYW